MTDFDGIAISERMLGFLREAAQCEVGKGFPPDPSDRRIASKAVDDGYGTMLGITGFMLFIINELGRDMVEAAK